MDKIYSYISDTDKTLVFTSETAARNTLLSFISDNRGKAVFRDRFLSWDTFEKSLSDTTGLREVSETERRIFVSSFLKNGGLEKLSHFASPSSRAALPSFVRYISRLLPYFPSITSGLPSPMAEDINILRSEYCQYLKERKLFEKRYLEKDISRIRKDEFVFVYPESFTSNFAGTIVEKGLVDTIPLPSLSTSLPINKYRNAISEIRGVMRKIEKDLVTVPPEDIAITSSSLDTYRPYMEEEAKKRDIPLIFTSSSPLSSYPEGKLLSSFLSLHNSRWSLPSVKTLLSEPSYPFKDREILNQIIRIGIDMKMDGGGYGHWMAAFDCAIKKKGEKAEEAKSLFDSLYKAVSLIVKAKNPLDTERRIREFRDTYFLEGAWNEKDDRILGSALEILEGMAGMEDEDTYRIFLSILKDTSYVERNDSVGVKVYAYPASAGLKVKRHYIMGLDDRTTRKEVDDFPFLPEGKKPISEDKGKAFLTLYANPEFAEETYISGTTEGFDGSRLLPTFFLDKEKKVETVEEDSYNAETIAEREKIKCPRAQSISHTNALKAALKKRKKEDKVEISYPLSVSVGEVRAWDTCPFKGFASSVLKAREKDWVCSMEDKRTKGNVLHETLQFSLEEKHSFSEITEEDILRNLEKALYRHQKKREIPDEAARIHMEASIIKKLSSFEEAKNLGLVEDAKLVKNEMVVSGLKAEDTLIINGRIDTVLKDDGGKWYIIDYKNSGDSDWGKDNLDDNSLQVILYYHLLSDENSKWDMEEEKPKHMTVECGGFYSLSANEFRFIWPYVEETKEGFNLQEVLDNAKERIKRIAENIRNGVVKPDPSEKNCDNCDYKRLCRGGFVVR